MRASSQPARSDRSIKIWDADMGNEIRTLNGHSNSVLNVRFSESSDKNLLDKIKRNLSVYDMGTRQSSVPDRRRSVPDQWFHRSTLSYERRTSLSEDKVPCQRKTKN